MIEKAVVLAIRFYRAAISPLTPAACRYRPTCSEYAIGAIEAHGPWRGGWLAVRRIFRCHPFGGRGWDPVPPAEIEAREGRPGDAEGGATETEPARYVEPIEGHGQ